MLANSAQIDNLEVREVAKMIGTVLPRSKFLAHTKTRCESRNRRRS
jgi:hypothetical protein